MKTSFNLGRGWRKDQCTQSKQKWQILVTASLCVLLWLSSNPFAKMSHNLGWLRSPDLKLVDSSSLASRQFNWYDIEPSESLSYTPCYGKFLCARLSVPLNWNASSAQQENGRRLAVAILKLPAKVPITHPQYGGPIILNPGGPGESGVMQILAEGEYIQTIVDDPSPPTLSMANPTDGKYFDILSFDPRGVNNTKPGLNCFPNPSSQIAQLRSYMDYGHLWDTESIIGTEWALASALGLSCSEEEFGHEVLPFVNTAQVVEDMAAIVQQEGHLRASTARKLVKQEHSNIHTEELLDKTSSDAGKEKLQYWGTSYGTLIGSTFAAMHPDRVGRVIIDGVVDPADYYVTGGLTSLQDSDQIIAKFSEYCYKAGPEDCPLYCNASAEAIEDRFTAAMMYLKANPLPLLLPATGNFSTKTGSSPAILTYGDIHLYLLAGMYFPLGMAEKLFHLVHDVETRNTTSPRLIDVVRARLRRETPDKCQLSDPISGDCSVPYSTMLGPFQAISCLDAGGGPANFTRRAFDKYLVELKSQGRWIFPNWARNKLVCLGFEVAPAWRPDLDFSNSQAVHTSHPLLIIGNSHDTVTPIANARRVSGIFPGSVVLHQSSEGHCSHSAPSLCKAKAVREYFQTGSLPNENTVCEPDFRPFVGCVKLDGCEMDDHNDEKLLKALLDLADPYRLKQNFSSDHSSIILRKLENFR